MLKDDDIQWFLQQFAAAIQLQIHNSPLTLPLITAIACQETGYLWSRLRRKGLPVADILACCVGDVLDAPKRSAFPQTKADLLQKPQGALMFDIARQALVDMANATGDKAYLKALENPAKFCHGFGVFQRDLQFFATDPAYFLEKRYTKFADSLQHCVALLTKLLRKVGANSPEPLTVQQAIQIAIAYNTGRCDPKKGAQQGYFDGERYYGEYIADYLRQAQSLLGILGPTPVSLQHEALARVSPPSTPKASGPWYQVQVATSLNLRRAPDATSPILKTLADGQRVRAFDQASQLGFMHIEVELQGALLQGFVASQYLKADESVAPTPVPSTPATTAIPAVWLANRSGQIHSRAQSASAFSLNELDQPTRQLKNQPGDAQQLRTQLAAIINWLDVARPTHLRYKAEKSTFCNLYAHDYCHLAAVYLPRVWWLQDALLRLAAGDVVEPRYGSTVQELSANGLFAWLKAFGPQFGWRQTSNLNRLQAEANQGAVCLIIAQHVLPNQSGHVSMVVAESASFQARRNRSGDVELPLQSQAGRRNFSYGLGTSAWWQASEFRDFAFWLHA